MHYSFGELAKVAFTVFFIMLIIMMGKMYYNINQVNEYQKQVQQLIQKNGGITDGHIKVSGDNADDKPVYTDNVLDVANKQYKSEYRGYFTLIPAPDATGKEDGVPSLAELNCGKDKATEEEINHPDKTKVSAAKKRYDRGRYDSNPSPEDKEYAQKIDKAYTKQKGYWQDKDGYYHITQNIVTVDDNQKYGDLPNQYGRIVKYYIKMDIPTIRLFNLRPEIVRTNAYQTTSELAVNDDDN